MCPTSDRTSQLLEEIDVEEQVEKDKGFIDFFGEEATVANLVASDDLVLSGPPVLPAAPVPSIQAPTAAPLPSVQTPPLHSVQTPPLPSVQTPPLHSVQTPPLHSVQTPPLHSIQTPVSRLHHSPVSRLHHSPVSRLHHCPVSKLHHCTVSRLHHSPLSRLYHCTVSKLHHCPVSRLHHSPVSRLHHCPVSKLHHCTVSKLHHCTVSRLHHSPLSRLHHCTASKLQSKIPKVVPPIKKSSLPVQSTSVESPDTKADHIIPPEYRAFQDVFIQFLGYIIDPQGVKMDQGKVDAITHWPQPGSIKELQRFLGFANFYRRSIKDYSLLRSPLTSLLRNWPKSLSWNPDATEAFHLLKQAFKTAPILVHPDPKQQFIVEKTFNTLLRREVQEGNSSSLLNIRLPSWT
ncbi:pollen-specific leucine-rich repeat extensin-like protein 1 [Carassius auratus]|uniref:Pollen-specific leucine-rich repeat extensin-like protein 1 n=1 Tax=Carassius auratus TaxID=7957 RepID=A0A6P6RKF3_CARAU|nr:pollen-specific leucine-rich repeat extensin-like protein 1 [Carassius auratus]